MIKIHSVRVYGLEDAIKTSGFSYNANIVKLTDYLLTEKDLKRSITLAHRGGGEDKFLRFITVQFVLSASRYFWTEFDTYHFKERNSQGSLHTIKKLDLSSIQDQYTDDVIWNRFKELVEMYKKDPSERNRYILKSSLPEGFVQTSAISTNYSTLKNMFNLRHDHPLREWRIFCNSFIKQLPLSSALIVGDNTFTPTDDTIKLITNYYDLPNITIDAESDEV